MTVSVMTVAGCSGEEHASPDQGLGTDAAREGGRVALDAGPAEAAVLDGSGTPVAPPVTGGCGPANLTTTAATPAQGLCVSGTPSPVTTESGGWTWSCQGRGSGSSATCLAQTPADAGTFNATVQLAPTSSDPPVNRLLSGTQIEHMYQGDEITDLDGDLYDWCQGCGNNPYFYTPYTNASVETWNQPAETLLSQMNATLLRYPGGSWAESYHWADGVGPLSVSLGEEHGYPVLFGTQEYLEL